MSEKLILRLSSQANNIVPWLVWSEQANEVIASGELPSIANVVDIAHYAKGRQAVVLVDGADVRLHQQVLQTKPNRQILKALPFMLEDELAEDIDDLHFIPGDTGINSDGQHWVNVAIINKAILTTWLDTLAQADIQVKQMLPEQMCLPQVDEGEVNILELGGNWIIKQAQWLGSTMHQAWVPLFLQDLNRSVLEGETLTVKSYSPITFATEAYSNIELQTQQPELPLALLAAGIGNVKCNLLQGEFAPKKQINKTWLIWRPVVIVLVIALLLKLISQLVFIYKAESEQQQLVAQLEREYTAAFPKEKLRINLVRNQLRRKLAVATGTSASGSNGFLSVLDKITPVLAQADKITMQSLRFDQKRSELRLSVAASSFQAFEQFRAELEKTGLDVKQGTMNNDGEQVVGTLSVKGL